MSPFAVAALYDPHLPVGASAVAAVLRVVASDIDATGVEAALRLWTPVGATVAVLGEVSPATVDLRDRALRLDDRTVEYAVSRWTSGPREYELAVALPPRRAGDEMLAARFGVAVDGAVVARARIAVAWFDDERRLGPSGAGATASTLPVVAVTTELPTGRSPEPRHVLAGDRAAGDPCPACGTAPAEGDRFCECCGRALGAGGQR